MDAKHAVPYHTFTALVLCKCSCDKLTKKKKVHTPLTYHNSYSVLQVMAFELV